MSDINKEFGEFITSQSASARRNPGGERGDCKTADKCNNMRIAMHRHVTSGGTGGQ